MCSTPKIVDANFSQQLVYGDPNDSKLATIQQIFCSDFLVVTQDDGTSSTDRTTALAPTADITIYCDQLRIAGPILAPGRKVHIVARVLETAPR